jgi:hypothetical protein
MQRNTKRARLWQAQLRQAVVLRRALARGLQRKKVQAIQNLASRCGLGRRRVEIWFARLAGEAWENLPCAESEDAAHKGTGGSNDFFGKHFSGSVGPEQDDI